MLLSDAVIYTDSYNTRVRFAALRLCGYKTNHLSSSEANRPISRSVITCTPSHTEVLATSPSTGGVST